MATEKTESEWCTLQIVDGPAINSLVCSLSFNPIGDRPSVHFTAAWGRKTFFFRLIITSLKRLDEQQWTFEGIFPSKVSAHHAGDKDVVSNNYSTGRRKGYIEIPQWVVKKLNEGIVSLE